MTSTSSRDALLEKDITPCIAGPKIRNKTAKYDKRRYKRCNRIKIMFRPPKRLETHCHAL